MQYKNEMYNEIREYIKQHNGWSKRLMEKDGLLTRYNNETEKIKQFNNKKVLLKYKSTSDYFTREGIKQGRIRITKDNKIFFTEGKKRSKGYWLDAGLYEGFYAVLIVKELTTL